MTELPGNYLSPKLEMRQHPDKGGYGIYAQEPLKKGELIVVWGGYMLTGEQFHQLPPHARQHSLQVEEDIFQVPLRPDDPAEMINHSCQPNAGLQGNVSLVALRAIMAGEEICFDYAMSDGSAYDEFDCGCGTASCRGRVSGNDWQRPELQKRYAGYFSPYLQRRIHQQYQKEHTNGHHRPVLEARP
ncbi:MAG: SET domain-containing protein [Chloroflexi bacterium]|nr:SET domain-containing protein [Chloroflexota bacterium]MBP8054698.1 SET domain-containing protein [Chloroflexota bacterium]